MVLGKKAQQGIGTLIIFIALILVAAVAAGVLIQTSSSLQSTSLDVGRQSQEKITSGVNIMQIYAKDTTDGNITSGMDNMTVFLRSSSGSEPIKLQDTLVRLDTKDGTQALTFSGSDAYDNETYGVTYKINGSNHKDGYITTGDLAQLTFQVDQVEDIKEGQTATLRVITKNGAVKPVQVTAPSSMLTKTTYLFP